MAVKDERYAGIPIDVVRQSARTEEGVNLARLALERRANRRVVADGDLHRSIQLAQR